MIARTVRAADPHRGCNIRRSRGASRDLTPLSRRRAAGSTALVLTLAAAWMGAYTLTSAQTPEKRALTVDDYTRWRSISGQEISSDGNWVAYVLQFTNTAPAETKPVLHLVKLDSNQDVDDRRTPRAPRSRPTRSGWRIRSIRPADAAAAVAAAARRRRRRRPTPATGGAGRHAAAQDAQGRGGAPRRRRRRRDTSSCAISRPARSSRGRTSSRSRSRRRRRISCFAGGRRRPAAARRRGAATGGDAAAVAAAAGSRRRRRGDRGDRTARRRRDPAQPRDRPRPAARQRRRLAFNKAGDLLAYTVDAAVKDSNGLFVLDLGAAASPRSTTTRRSTTASRGTTTATAIAVLKGLDVDKMRERNNVLVVYRERRQRRSAAPARRSCSIPRRPRAFRPTGS